MASSYSTDRANSDKSKEDMEKYPYRLIMPNNRGVASSGPDALLQALNHEPDVWRGIELTEVELLGIFALAKITIVNHWKTPNQYWGNAINAHPWWLVRTDFDPGLIEIGYRKRVMSIDWADTKIRGIVTEDDVTKDETSVHAYTTPKAVEYMIKFKALSTTTKG